MKRTTCFMLYDVRGAFSRKFEPENVHSRLSKALIMETEDLGRAWELHPFIV
jgi:hypothetical protein